MKQLICLITSIFLLQFFSYGQSLAVNTDGSTANASALLDVKSTTKGILIPRMSRTQRNALASPATGLMIFQDSPDSIGLYYYTGSTWTWMLNKANSDTTVWKTGGNTGTTDPNYFIGTTDNVPLNIRVNNQSSGRIDPSKFNAFFGYQSGNTSMSGTGNTAFGHQALQSNTFGFSNVAIGYNSLNANVANDNVAIGYWASQYNNNGYENVGVGSSALRFTTVGNDNTAIGYSALNYNAGGSSATAVGSGAMQYHDNTTTAFTNACVGVGYQALRGLPSPNFNTGNYNTAIGYQSMTNNTNGSYNVGAGTSALGVNQTGAYNTAIGEEALYHNVTNANTSVGYQSLYSTNMGGFNTAIGYMAMWTNTGGANGTAIGARAMYYAYSGSGFNNYNVAVGYEALRGSATPSSNSGNYNTVIGYQSGMNNSSGSSNVGVGYLALNSTSTGSNNTAVGTNADAVGTSNSTAIGYGAVVNSDNKIRLGNSSVTVVEGQVAYSFPSDGRFKYNISESEVKGLDFILKLHPVVYNFDTKKFEEFITQRMPDSLRAKHISNIDFSKSSAVRQSGFVAQDVEKAMVSSGYDFNGVHKPSNENDNYSVSYSLFVVPLVKAVQEQQAMIDKQAKEIDELKTTVKALAGKK